MYRTALRTASRPALRSLRSANARPTIPRRFASTASPADRPRGWKSSAARWGLAVGAVYYYTTSPVFAEEPTVNVVAAPAAFSDDDLPTVDSVIEQKRREINARLEKPYGKTDATETGDKPKSQTQAPTTAAIEGSPEDLEEEAGQQGAFNPETGEINWDCPCLGGMAHGPCGEDFKTAFSCFVYSEEEPKGMDCIDKFQGMQDCFRKYPEVYGAELADEEEAERELNEESAPPAAQSVELGQDKPETQSSPATSSAEHEAMPKWEDATAANQEAAKDGKDTAKEDKE